MRAIKRIALSLIITVIIVLSAFLTRGIAPAFWKLIYFHGLYPYIMIFFALWALLDSISNDWKFNRLGLLPGLIGVLGFLEGLVLIFSSLADVMCGAWELVTVKGILANEFIGLRVSLKLLLLGVGLSLFLFAISTCVLSCRKPIKE